MQPDSSTSEGFREELLCWGTNHIRSYPWRYQTDPYAIIVAEFMLHRTQTSQVIPVYQKFMMSYPTLQVFCGSNTIEAEAILRPLGLQWRITGMIAALRELWEKYKTVPTDLEKLIAVRGIGQYIAGAVICFAHNRPLVLVDTNIVRVVGRVFGLDLAGEARRRKEIASAIGHVCAPTCPRDFYYALIDLAHSICVPRKPDCGNCPLLAVSCSYGSKALWNQASDCRLVDLGFQGCVSDGARAS